MPTKAEIRGNRGHWLLDLTIGGRTFRFSDSPATVTDEAGVEHVYRAGLQDISHSMASAGLEASIGITINSDVDWATMVAKGIPLERAKGRLRRWYVGQTLERARIILTGLSQRVEYGASDEPLVFSLASMPVEQTTSLPPPQAVVTTDTWPVDLAGFDSKIEGSAYPFVIGAPGDNGSGVAMPAVPGLMCDYTVSTDTSKVMIAGHRVEASTVGLFNATDEPMTTSSSITVQTATDLLGRTISYVDLQGSMVLAPDVKWYIAYKSGSGGMLNEAGSAALRGAGDVLLLLLERYSNIPIDRLRMQAQAARLNAYKIDAVINTPTNVWTWLQQTVVPLLPVMMRETSDGLFFQFLDWNATAVDATVRLDASTRQIERSGPVKLTGDAVFNEVTIEYAPFATSQRYRRSRTITAQADKLSIDPLSTADSRILGDYRAKVSQDSYGVRPLTIKSSAIWETATATRIAQDKIAQLALPKRAINYVGGAELESLEVGSVVTINDPELSITDAPALLMDVVVGSGSTVQLSVVLLDAVPHQPRLAG